jgi:ribosome-binding protein aMBF1 (putative translation factor)
MSIKSSLPSFASDPHSIIYKVRQSRRISVEELSRRSGVSAQDIRRCERKNVLPGDQALTALAKALLVKTAVLLGKQKFVPDELPPEIQPSPAFIAHTRRIQEMFGGNHG